MKIGNLFLLQLGILELGLSCYTCEVIVSIISDNDIAIMIKLITTGSILQHFLFFHLLKVFYRTKKFVFWEKCNEISVDLLDINTICKLHIPGIPRCYKETYFSRVFRKYMEFHWMPKLPSYRNQSIDLLCKSIDWLANQLTVFYMIVTLAFNELM